MKADIDYAEYMRLSREQESRDRARFTDTTAVVQPAMQSIAQSDWSIAITVVDSFSVALRNLAEDLARFAEKFPPPEKQKEVPSTGLKGLRRAVERRGHGRQWWIR